MRFDDWNNDELYHHGIKGQKWGIRRYQNPDGSLTEAGQRRVLKTMGHGYLAPSVKDIKRKKAINRVAVGDQYDKAYWDEIEKGMPRNEPSKIGKKLWDRYKDKYAQATLKDLKLKDTKKARAQVQNILRKYSFEYEYSKDWFR